MSTQLFGASLKKTPTFTVPCIEIYMHVPNAGPNVFFKQYKRPNLEMSKIYGFIAQAIGRYKLPSGLNKPYHLIAFKFNSPLN